MQQTYVITNSCKQVLSCYDFLCSDGHFATFACIAQGCLQNAFICANDQCSCVKIQHKQCTNKITVQQFIKTIQTHRQQIPQKVKFIFQDILNHYDHIIEKLSEDRAQFITYTQIFGLTNNMIQVVNLLKQQKQINSQHINTIWKETKSQAIYYVPQKLKNHNMTKSISAEIQNLFERLRFQIANQTERVELALNKFGKSDINQRFIITSYRHWECIPIQVSIFAQLQKLTLSHHNIRFISNLEQLTHLQLLNLEQNQITQMKGVKFLTNVSTLYLTGNKIRNIENLENLNKLQVLRLNKNCITQIKGLQKLVKLRELLLQNNEISQIKGLEKLRNLKVLCLHYNQLTEINNLENLTNLQRLDINFNKITKVQYLEKMTQLKILYIYPNPFENTETALQILKKMKNNGLSKTDMPSV